MDVIWTFTAIVQAAGDIRSISSAELRMRVGHKDCWLCPTIVRKANTILIFSDSVGVSETQENKSYRNVVPGVGYHPIPWMGGVLLFAAGEGQLVAMGRCGHAPGS